ncbi:MAG: ribonuclease P protein component [Rudaea sp.]
MARLCLPRSARLLRPIDFRAAREIRQRLTTANFVAEFWPAPGDGARLGMAVSRRVSKRAVVRNRIRRQIRESFRIRRRQLLNVDVLMIARSRAATQDNATLRGELSMIWHKLVKRSNQSLKQSDANGTMRADA